MARLPRGDCVVDRRDRHRCRGDDQRQRRIEARDIEDVGEEHELRRREIEPCQHQHDAECRDHELGEDCQRRLRRSRQPLQEKADDDVLLCLVDVGDAEEIRDQHRKLRDLLRPPDRARQQVAIADLHHRQDDDEYEGRHGDPQLDECDRRQCLAEGAHRPVAAI